MFQNEFLKSEVLHMIKNNVKQGWTEDSSLVEQLNSLKISNELVYKVNLL